MSQGNKKSISIGIVINLLAVVILKGFALFTSPYITGVLSTAEYGDMSVYNTWAGVLSTIAGCGMTSSLAIYKVNNSEDKYYKYSWNVLSLATITHAFAFAFSIVNKDIIASLIKLPEWVVPIMVISAYLQYILSFLSTFFLVNNEAAVNLVFSLITSVGGFATGVCIIKCYGGFANAQYMSFILGYTIMYAIVDFVYVVFYLRRGISWPDIDNLRFALRIGIPMVFHSLAGTILVSSDRVMVQRMVSSDEAGTYAFAYTFANVLCGVWGAINSIWSPFYFSYLKDKDYDNLKRKRVNFDVLYGALTVGFLMVYPEFYRLLANERYWVSMDIVPIIVVAFVFFHLYSFPQGYETYREKTVYVAMGTIAAAMVNLGLNILLIPMFAGLGAALATAISYFFFYVFHKWIAVKVIGKYPFGEYKDIYFVLVCVVSIVLCVLLKSNWILRWIIATIDGVMLLYRIIRKRAIL